MNLNLHNILARPVGNELVLLNSINGEMYRVNETGQVIWNLIKADYSIEKISEELTQNYHLTIDEAQKYTLKFIQDIEKALS